MVISLREQRELTLKSSLLREQGTEGTDHGEFRSL